MSLARHLSTKRPRRLSPGRFIKSYATANLGLKQQHVCHAIGIRRANFVTLLDDLEHRGLARRGPSAHDQRARALYLTEDGGSLMRELRTVNQAHEKKIAAGLSQERRRLLIEMLNEITRSADSSGE